MRTYMDIKEFYEGGFLQEVNRQFFHPLGLALEVVFEDDGTLRLGGIQDSREDPEGFIFRGERWENGEAVRKAKNVQNERDKHAPYRNDLFGQEIQPLPEVDSGS